MNGKCKYCAKECKNVTVHERFCKSNPDKVQNLPVKTDNPEVKQTESEQPKQQETPVIISNLIQIITPLQAWYEDGIHRQIEAVGVVNSDGNKIPWGLVMTSNGMLLPPYMLPGFVGVSELPPETESDTTEPFPPFPEETDEPEPTKITTTNKIPEGVITEEHKTISIKKPIKTGFWDIFKRKPRPVPTEYKPVSVETRNLLKEISEV